MTDGFIVSSTITTVAAMNVTNNQSLTTKRDRQTDRLYDNGNEQVGTSTATNRN